MSYEANNRAKRELAPTRKEREQAARETKTTKVNSIMLLHIIYDRTFSKIISGILSMAYSAVNHSYDSKTTIKIISGITTMIYSSINHSYDSKRTNKIISGIITVLQ